MNILVGSRWHEYLGLPGIAGEEARRLADTHLRSQPDGVTWGLKVDGRCLRLDEHIPTDARTVELVDVTEFTWPAEPAPTSNPEAETADPVDTFTVGEADADT